MPTDSSRVSMLFALGGVPTLMRAQVHPTPRLRRRKRCSHGSPVSRSNCMRPLQAFAGPASQAATKRTANSSDQSRSQSAITAAA